MHQKQNVIFAIVKRSIVFSLIGLYVVATIGIAFNLHYCGGKVSNISLVLAAKNCEGQPVKKETSNCCKDQKVEYKVKADQKAPVETKAPTLSPTIELQTIFIEHFLPILKSTVLDYFFDRGPPNESVSLHLLYCLFRI